jgi:acetoacetyl-CoA synthetase
MMWNWQLSALTLGATICLYDGNPGYPDLDKIWRIVEQLEVTHFGTSGRFLEACMKRSPPFKKGDLGDLPALKAILYTGSPLSPGGFEWVYRTVKDDIHFAGISGGTDIVSCFVLGNPNLPVRAGEIQCRGLGVDVVAMDDSGNAVQDQPGELVCRQPLPSMPLYFLNDPDGEKYRQAYFSTFPGFWRHGDFIEFKSNGGIVIYGRSDATLNPGGVRIGSAEIYSALDSITEVTAALAVGWQPPGQSDEVIVLFVVLQEDAELGEETRLRIARAIRMKCSPKHVPGVILPVSAIPVTRSGKPVELSVKAVLKGQPVRNRDALANPEILHEFEEARKELLQQWPEE